MRAYLRGLIMGSVFVIVPVAGAMAMRPAHTHGETLSHAR